jgi:Ran-binding protein 1
MASTSEPQHQHRDDEEAPHNDDEDTGAQIAPIIKLEEVAVSTGEENEDALFDLKAKVLPLQRKISHF